MIQKNHKVTITVNNQLLELSDVDSLNLRMNNIVYDPTKISSSQAEYSFTFNVPITPTNVKVFDWANILSKSNKFNKLYVARVFADGNEIFKGQLKISSIDNGKFKCNLVSVKVNNVEEIFGDSTMNEVVWKVPYEGMETIKEINADLTTDYFFPLVCYGVFQKEPYTTYTNEYNAYTSKYLLDKYVQWYDESFSPSVRLNELVKKMFEQKGYSVNGDIFEDDIANAIYLSTNLGGEQVPVYNIGNPTIGDCTVTWSFRNRKKVSNDGGYTNFSLPPLAHALNFPQEFVSNGYYNWEIANFWEIWYYCNLYKDITPGDRPNVSALELNVEATNNNIWRDGYIVIPADGAYKIEMDVTLSIDEAEDMKGLQYTQDGAQVNTDIAKNWDNMPIEVHLLRNANEGDLIYGYNGKVPTVYPHEPQATSNTAVVGDRNSGASNSPSTIQGGGMRGNGRRNSGARATVIPPASRGGEDYGIDPITGMTLSRATITYDTTDPQPYNMGYMPKQGELLCFDPWVNPNFICGFTSVNNSASVIKNGYSWNSESLDKNYVRYNCNGYYGVNYDGGSYTWEQTTYNKNNYNGAPTNSLTDTGTYTKKGKVSCIVWLKRNDVLSLHAVAKDYEQEGGSTPGMRPGQSGTYTPSDYALRVDGTFSISPYSPKQSDVEDSSLTYNSPTKFDVDLNLGQFMNNETKQSDFINNYIKAFNLVFSSTENTVTLNKNYIDFKEMFVPIKLDNRVYNENISIQPIDYPKSMEINYKIDDEEAGFYNSVPHDKLEDDDWKEYAFTGSEKIELSQNEDAEETSVSLSNSYDWYVDFSVNQYNLNGDVTETLTISLPIISKDEYMIENYKYEESMSVDGKSLSQRWWFRQSPNNNITFTTVNDETFHPSIPTNEKDGFSLNYMNNENTLLTRFFNIIAYVSSDMIEFETYLTPDEYILLKKGASIKVNSDIYIICEIVGFDPSGSNPTKLKAIKKV